jgi:hypothetical protein
MEAPELLNEQEVSRLTTIPVRRLRNWRCQRRELAFHKLGASVFYSRADVLEYIAQNRKPPIDRDDC